MRLKEKAQDNISKWAAVEKESLTLEKDKEDQSKYYLSHPKWPVLDMKWENRDITVIEWTNVSSSPEWGLEENVVLQKSSLPLIVVG